MASLSAVTKQMQKQAIMANQLNSVLSQSSLAKSTGKFIIKNINMDRVKKKLMKIEKKMKNVDVSKNPTYHNFDTFQRPNRREPMNPDLPGVSMDLGYYPDIHLYVDTSGSISQKDYEDSVAMIIDIAKKLNCDIYFNSFTTDISQETVVRCRNRTKYQIQKDIERIPKLDGGTTIDQVWSYINATRKNRKQLSSVNLEWMNFSLCILTVQAYRELYLQDFSGLCQLQRQKLFHPIHSEAPAIIGGCDHRATMLAWQLMSTSTAKSG